MASFSESLQSAYNKAVETGKGVGQITSESAKKIFSTPVINDDTLSQSQYDFTYRAFPSDLGADYNGHYMVININVPTKSGGEPRGAFTNRFTPLPNDFSKVDILRFGKGSGATGLGGQQREFFAIPRYTKRIAESIALFMPSPLVYTTENKYEDISLTAMAGSVGVGALQGLVSAIPIARSIGSNLIGATGQVIGTAAKLAGYPINPRVEVLFSTTPQRQFNFEVLMAPRNEEESQSIQRIITTLRFHAAPELDTILNGLTFIPPAEFDITFYNKGVENTNIPRINTCVLGGIDVDVAPQGKYATFRNGHPVAVRLVLRFVEIEILHKLRVVQGF
jgi:hypothetical protein